MKSFKVLWFSVLVIAAFEREGGVPGPLLYTPNSLHNRHRYQTDGNDSVDLDTAIACWLSDAVALNGGAKVSGRIKVRWLLAVASTAASR